MFGKIGKKVIPAISPEIQKLQQTSSAELQKQLNELRVYTSKVLPETINANKRAMAGLEQLSQNIKGMINKH